MNDLFIMVRGLEGNEMLPIHRVLRVKEHDSGCTVWIDSDIGPQPIEITMYCRELHARINRVAGRANTL